MKQMVSERDRSSTKSNDQEKLKKLVIEGDQSSKKIVEDEKAGHEKKNVTKQKIVARYAKSGKSSCKKCSEKIESKCLKLGLSCWDQNTKWHHLDCFFHLDADLVSPELIQGFSELKSDDQDKLKKMVIEGDQSSKKREGDDETESDNKHLKKLKTIEDEKTGQEKKNATNQKIVAQYAKSGKSSCKKCSEKIESKCLKLGLSCWDPRGFEKTKWHHLDCFFHLDANLVSPELIQGFLELKSDDQEKLKKLVIEGDPFSKKRERDDEADSDKRDLKKLKIVEDEKAGQEKKNVTNQKIVAEYAKSRKSSCKICSEKIESKSLRLGLSHWARRGFEYIKWHHLDCLFHLDVDLVSPELIEGFSELKSDDQEKLKKLVAGGDQSSKKREGDDETESNKRDLAKRKTVEDEKAGQEKKNVTNPKSDDQELKKLVIEGNQSFKKREGDDETESDKRDLKKLKTVEDEKAVQEKKNVTNQKIVAEYAKSAKSSCKKCSEKIESNSIRLGLSHWDRRGFEYTKWHHLDCFFHLNADLVPPELIEGFSELKSDDQEKLKKLVIEGDQSSKKREGDDETDSDKRDLKKLKTGEDEKAGQEKKSVTNQKIVAEYAKSGKASCKKCSEKIESKSLRLGLSHWDRRGFEYIKWHHLGCLFHLDVDLVSPELIEGFSELKSDDQEKLKKLVIEGDQSSKERGDDETKSDKRDLKKLKSVEDEKAGQDKKNVTNQKVVAEYAKSGKSSCKKCSEKIESKSLRLGLSHWDPRGFEYTKWHHLDCFFQLDADLVSPELIEGFSKLKSDDQEKLKKLVIEGDHSSQKREGDDEIESDKKDLTKLKTVEDEKAGQEKKNVTNQKIVAEYAKSGKSSCKKCSEKIESKSLRLGLSHWDRRGFEYTKWHHLECLFHLDVDLVSPELIEGFSELKSDDQEKLKKLVIEVDQSSKKRYLLQEQAPLNDDQEKFMKLMIERDQSSKKSNEDGETELQGPDQTSEKVLRSLIG